MHLYSIKKIFISNFNSHLIIQLRSNLITKGGYGALLTEDVKAAKAGEGSSSQSDKPKANDISHLIKRKKPEASDDASPAKKPAP